MIAAIPPREFVVRHLAATSCPSGAAATEVSGGTLETGHYLAEEDPKAVIESFERFFV